jgi:6-phosphogluconolactonase
MRGAAGRLGILISDGQQLQPSSENIVATGEKSETISVYAIDQASGALKFLNKHPTGKGANWVEIASFD